MSVGYINIGIDGVDYYAHRLAWLYCNGYMPDEIDHKNLDKSDNRISNLRSATRSQNVANSSLRKASSSGAKGVCWDRNNRRWVARVHINKKQVCLGYFRCKADAAQAYKDRAKNVYGEFYREA